MASTSATNLAAVIPSKNGRLTVSTRNIPTLGPGELLVRNHAIAANPVDWKIQDYALFISTYPTVLGSDVAGIVVSVGPSVTHFAPGDRVIGFSAVIYNDNADHGAWQTYTLLREIGASKLPASMTFEQGSVFPMGMATAAIALFVTLGIPRALAQGDADAAQKPSSALLVWGVDGAARPEHGPDRLRDGEPPTSRLAQASRRGRDIGLPRPGRRSEARGRGQDPAGTSIDLALDPISEGAKFDQVPATVAAGGKGQGGDGAALGPRVRRSRRTCKSI